MTVVDDRRLEGSETVNLNIGSLNTTLNGTVSIVDSTDTVTITDNETGTINFEGDKSTPEIASTSVKATLTIGSTGTGTIGLDQTLTVSATDAGTGTATGGGVDYTYSTTTLTFSPANSALIDSSTAASDRRRRHSN